MSERSAQTKGTDRLGWTGIGKNQASAEQMFVVLSVAARLICGPSCERNVQRRPLDSASLFHTQIPNNNGGS